MRLTAARVHAAIKQLLPELSGHREIVERFFNEAKAGLLEPLEPRPR